MASKGKEKKAMRDRDCTFGKTRSSRFGKNVNLPRGDSEALSIGTVLDVSDI
jgi:hypothetical protein